MTSTPIAAVELRPCPFCGNQPKLTEWEKSNHVTDNGHVCPEVWMIGCNCFFVRTLAHHGTREDAIAKWNTRNAAVKEVVEAESILERFMDAQAASDHADDVSATLAFGEATERMLAYFRRKVDPLATKQPEPMP